MTPTHTDALTDALTVVLETATFAFAEPGEAPFPSEVNSLLTADIRFTGQARGGLALTVPHPLARELAANLMGMDAGEVGHGQAGDVVAELANMALWQWLSRVWGKDAIFHVAPPTWALVPAEDWPARCDQPGAVSLTVEGWPVRAALDLPQEAADGSALDR